MLEFLDSEPLCASLEALGQARRLGSAVGMTVYALAPMQEVSPQARERLGQVLGHFGADGVVMLTADATVSESELRFAPYARALLQACEELPPKLFLLADTPAARDIAPRLAARIGGIYLAAGDPVCEQSALRLYDATGQLISVCDDPLADEMFAPTMVPVVMTLPAGRYAMSRGSSAVPVRFMAPIDGDSSSERTPVPGGGFTEEGHEPLRRKDRLWLQTPEFVTMSTVPPLAVVAAEGQSFDRRLVYTVIALGPRSVDRSDAQLAVPVGDGAVGEIGAGIEAAFAKPRERSGELNVSGLLAVDRDDDEDAAGSAGRTWDGSDISTGDTEPRVPADTGAAAGEAAPASPLAASGGGVAVFAKTSAGDGENWDGEPTPQEDADAVPQVELDGIDTEPIGDAGSGKEAEAAGKVASATETSDQREVRP
jgi:hypothetical protein